MTRLPVFTMLSAGWDTFKRRPGFFIAATLCGGLVPLMISHFLTLIFIPDGAEAAPVGNLVALQLVSAVMQSFIAFCMYRLALAAVDHIETLSWDDMWMPNYLITFISFLIVSLLYTVMVGVGLVVLIIPGLVLATMLGFSLFAIADRALGPFAALSTSYRLTKGHLWSVFRFGIVLVLLNILGMIALVVGLVVTLPISGLAAAHAYRFLSSEAEAQGFAAPSPR